MRIVFLYRGWSGGVFGFPMECDGRRTWDSVCLDAHVLAAEIAGEPVTHIICQHPGAARVGKFQSIEEVVVPVVTRAALELS